jgi:hypothetical protein
MKDKVPRWREAAPRAQMGRKKPKRGRLDQGFGRDATVPGIAAIFSGTISVNSVPFGMQKHRRRVEPGSKPRPPDFCDTPVLIPRIMDERPNALSTSAKEQQSLLS